MNHKIEYKRLEIFATLWNYIFARLIRITFKLGKFTNFKAPFKVFFFSTYYMDKLAKIRHTTRTERLKISKIAKFESDLSWKLTKSLNFYRRLYMSWFNFILGLNFVFFCFVKPLQIYAPRGLVLGKLPSNTE